MAAAPGPAGADELANKKAEAARVVAQLSADGQRISVLSEQLDQARIKSDQVNRELAQAQIELDQTSVHVRDVRSQLTARAVESYVAGGGIGVVQLLAGANGNDLALRRHYVDTISGQEREAIDALREAQQNLAAKQTALRTDQHAAGLAVDLVSQTEAAAAAVDRQDRTLLKGVQGDIAQLVAQQQAAEAAATAARVQAELQAREATQAASRAAAAARSTSAASPFAPSRGQASGAGTSPGGSDYGPVPAGAGGAVEEAKRQLGKPYAYGGAGPDSYDCSGLTMWAWGHAGVSLPHSAADQYSVTTHIPVSALQPGDLVFYGSPPHHVGIYVGSGQMIDALHSGTNVEYDSIYMEGDLIGGGRVN